MYLYIKNLLIEICGGKLTTSIVSKDPISDITRPVIMRQKQTDKFGSVQCNEREISLGNPTEQIEDEWKKEMYRRRGWRDRQEGWRPRVLF